MIQAVRSERGEGAEATGGRPATERDLQRLYSCLTSRDMKCIVGFPLQHDFQADESQMNMTSREISPTPRIAYLAGPILCLQRLLMFSTLQACPLTLCHPPAPKPVPPDVFPFWFLMQKLYIPDSSLSLLFYINISTFCWSTLKFTLNLA